jgi:hypothetical protein
MSILNLSSPLNPCAAWAPVFIPIGTVSGPSALIPSIIKPPKSHTYSILLHKNNVHTPAIAPLARASARSRLLQKLTGLSCLRLLSQTSRPTGGRGAPSAVTRASAPSEDYLSEWSNLGRGYTRAPRGGSDRLGKPLEERGARQRLVCRAPRTPVPKEEGHRPKIGTKRARSFRRSTPCDRDGPP